MTVHVITTRPCPPERAHALSTMKSDQQDAARAHATQCSHIKRATPNNVGSDRAQSTVTRSRQHTTRLIFDLSTFLVRTAMPPGRISGCQRQHFATDASYRREVAPAQNFAKRFLLLLRALVHLQQVMAKSVPCTQAQEGTTRRNARGPQNNSHGPGGGGEAAGLGRTVRRRCVGVCSERPATIAHCVFTSATPSPRGVFSSKHTASNSGTIAPFLKVPRSPPRAALGHVEYSLAASAKLISPDSIRAFSADASASPLSYFA